MTAKTIGAEWIKFYADDVFWPKGAWHEDEEITIDGKPWSEDEDLAQPPAVGEMTVSGGIVYLSSDHREGPSLEAYFRRWKKLQDTVCMVIEVQKDRADAVRIAVVSAGGKVHAP